MEVVSNNDLVLFLNANTDPFSGDFNSQLQNTLDTTIGNDNYDVGHLFVYENSIYGSAGCIACVCTTGAKGSGFTAHSDPNSDHFNMIASHEFGHQFGGLHVQSSSNCRSAYGLQEVEPGSGSSIMGYAGICFPNVQENPDDYFNYVDIRDVIQWTRNDSSCAELITTGNIDPIVNAGNDHIIPKSTAFILEGSGSDPDAEDILSFCWEENDPENPYTSTYPVSTQVYGPLFRSRPPISTPIRYMPQLSDIISGNLTPTWEILPSVSRTMDFVLTARDNAILGAKTASDEMTVTVDDNFGPFQVTSQNLTENWTVGTYETISWDVANTNQAPINATHVDIFLSIDGGYTYPYTIASQTLNDGTESIIIPEIPFSTSQGRLMVKASNNIFFSINTSNINIQTSDFILSFNDTNQTICQPNNATYSFTYETFLDFNETTTFSTENLPTGLNASFNPTTASVDGTIIEMTISNTNNITIGTRGFIVKGVSTSVERRNNVALSVFNTTLTEPILYSPSNNEANININQPLSWSEDPNAASYTVEIARDFLFTDIIETANVSENNFISNSLQANTIYFWKVKSINICGESSFSNIFTFTTACIDPNGVFISNTTSTSTDIYWTENGNASSWEIEIVSNGSNPTGTGIIANSNPYTVSSLDSNTRYDIYIRSSCSTTNSSNWVGPITFTTLPDFCNGDHFYDSGGATNPYQNNENNITVISPNGVDIVEVTFLDFNLEYSYDYLYVYNGNDTSGNLIGAYTGTSIPNVFRSNQGEGLTFHFISDSIINSDGWDAQVSCITVTCPAPTALNSTNITANSVDLNWTSNGDESNWQIEYGTTGFIQGNGTLVTADSNPFSLTGLNPFTNYDIYVKAVCGDNPNDDDSFWLGPITVNTPCDTFTAPFYEDFASYTTPNCWSEFGSESWNFNTNAAYAASNAGDKTSENNTNYAWIDGSLPNGENQISNLKTPWIDISNLISPLLEFYLFSVNENGNHYNTIKAIVHDNNGLSSELLVMQGSTEGWKQYYFDLSNLSLSNTIQIEFIIQENSIGLPYYNDILIDEVSVKETPSCPNPSNLEASNITANYVDLSWTSNGAESNWQIEYGTTGFIQGNGTLVTANSNPFSLTGLNPTTNYDIYVKAVCGNNPNDDDSIWIGPITIETPCGTFTAPYFYDVEQQTSSIVEDCWTSNPPTYNGSYFWSPFYSYNYNTDTGPYQAKSGNLFFATYPYAGSSNGDITELYSPIINITNLTNPVLDFYSFMHGENVGSLHIDIYNNGNWTEDVLVINEEQQQSATDLWQEQMITLNSFQETIQIRFRAIAGGNGLCEIDIDDISIMEMPSCPNPSNLQVSNIADSSVNLSWTSNGDESNWQIEYGATGFSQGNGNLINTNTVSYTIDNLNYNTEYDIYVKAICSESPNSDESLWIGPISFKTSINYCNGDHFYDSGGANGTYQNNENDITVISPLSGDYVEVTFLDFGLESCCDQLSIYDGPDINSPLIGSYTGTSSPGSFTSTHTTGTLTFRFTSDGSVTYSGWDALVNCISLSCPDPSNINIVNIEANNATINWENGGTETNWEIEYGLNNFVLGNGTKIETNNNPYTLEGLSPNTNYNFYLRAICGDETNEDNSQWVGPYSFTTICGVFPAPFYENFAGFVTPNCWSESGSEPWNFNKNASYAAANAGDANPENNTNYAWIDGSWPNGENQISNLKTSWIDISNLSSPSLEFYIFSVNENSDYYNTIKAIVHDNIGLSSEILVVQKSTEGWKKYNFDLSSLNLSNTIQIEFLVQENSIGFSYYNDILIDEIKVDDANTLSVTNSSISNFRYFPNPVENVLNIESKEQIDSVIIYNILGQKVHSTKFENNINLEIDLSKLPKGSYIVQVFSNNKIEAFQIVKSTNN